MVDGVTDVPTFAFDVHSSPTNTANIPITGLQTATLSGTVVVNGVCPNHLRPARLWWRETAFTRALRMASAFQTEGMHGSTARRLFERRGDAERRRRHRDVVARWPRRRPARAGS